ncbi:MAG: RNA polymerase subunit sigma-70, partial [Myxococcales bacterium]|nr:RNA polymerase subunit sigma-70 [Myxococcales bacterium]
MAEEGNEEETGESKDEPTLPVRAAPVALPKLKSPPRGSSTADLLSFYLSEVRRYPLLSPEEEKKYAVKYAETGDRESAERLVTSNLRLVIKIAFQYHRQWANVLDLIQE